MTYPAKNMAACCFQNVKIVDLWSQNTKKLQVCVRDNIDILTQHIKIERFMEIKFSCRPMAADLIFWDSFEATEYGLIFQLGSTLNRIAVNGVN